MGASKGDTLIASHLSRQVLGSLRQFKNMAGSAATSSPWLRDQYDYWRRQRQETTEAEALRNDASVSPVDRGETAGQKRIQIPPDKVMAARKLAAARKKIGPMKYPLSLQPVKAATLLALVLSTAIAFTSSASPDPVKSHSIVFVDSNGSLVSLHPRTGEITIIASGGYLVRPFAVIVDATGDFIISDTGSLAVVRIDHKTGVQTLIARGGLLGTPYGIALDRDGTVLVANAQTVVRVDPVTDTVSSVASSNTLRAPLGVAVDGNGRVFVVDALAGLVEINALSGDGKLVCPEFTFASPCGIAIAGNGDLLVTDMGEHSVVRINLVMPCRALVYQGGNLVTPVSVIEDDRGRILVGDPDAMDLDGGVIAIDAGSGEQSIEYQGSGGLVNPRGVAIVPSHR